MVDRRGSVDSHGLRSLHRSSLDCASTRIHIIEVSFPVQGVQPDRHQEFFAVAIHGR